VIGSESIGGAEDVAALRALPTDRYVLSLDFKGDRFQGPRSILDQAEHWPRTVIVMTLERVGSAEGPDLFAVAAIAKRGGPTRRIYAAGGVRHRADLEALCAAGAEGALVATALHAGTIKAGDLIEIAGL
jgi:phosphoribosylformimino-5-aminoimidazole carboxamide ribotide isomerase